MKLVRLPLAVLAVAVAASCSSDATGVQNEDPQGVQVRVPSPAGPRLQGGIILGSGGKSDSTSTSTSSDSTLTVSP
jgi:hypothetical protein